jgi:hypothetical protein
MKVVSLIVLILSCAYCLPYFTVFKFSKEPISSTEHQKSVSKSQNASTSVKGFSTQRPLILNACSNTQPSNPTLFERISNLFPSFWPQKKNQ